jgi:hypothetical protein
MQCVTEVRTVNPEHANLVSLKGDGMSFLWVNDEVHIVFLDTKAMGQIFHFVMIGQGNGYLIAMLDFDF